MTESELGRRVKELGLMPGVRGVAMDMHSAPARVRLTYRDDASRDEKCSAMLVALDLEIELEDDAAKLKAEEESRSGSGPRLPAGAGAPREDRHGN